MHSTFQFETEEQEQQRVKNEVGRMQGVIEREQAVAGKIKEAKRTGQVRQLLEGGWI
jgi:hypothetical protein